MPHVLYTGGLTRLRLRSPPRKLDLAGIAHVSYDSTKLGQLEKVSEAFPNIDIGASIISDPFIRFFRRRQNNHS
jgi:hypothetical protein